MIPGLGLGGDPSEAAFATGVLAGAGLREISQTLGLSKKRQQKPGMGAGGAQPSSAQMMEGNLGELDKIMLLAKLQAAANGGGPMGPDPLAAAAPPIPPPPMGLPGLPGPGLPGLPGPMGAPMGAPPIPAPAPGPAAGAPGGTLPLQMLIQMLGGAGGVV